MKTGLELHARGREIVTCECFDWGWPGNKPIQRKGYITKITPTAVTVEIPSTQPSTKIFSLVERKGYIYDRNSFDLARGWRMEIKYVDSFRKNVSGNPEVSR